MNKHFDIGLMARELLSRLPELPDSLHREVEQALRQSLQSMFAKMDLVTREEFDVQAALLARTREKLLALEKQLSEFEKQL